MPLILGFLGIIPVAKITLSYFLAIAGSKVVFK